MDYSKIWQNKYIKFIPWIILGIVFLLAFFSLGMIVGFKKSNFTRDWGENYHRNFAGPRKGLGNQFIERDLMNGNGLVGQIIKIENNTLIINGQDGVEKIISLNNKTTIRQFNQDLKIENLKINDFVVIIGEANQAGQIEARLIRLMPTPPSNQPQFPPVEKNVPTSIIPTSTNPVK